MCMHMCIMPLHVHVYVHVRVHVHVRVRVRVRVRMRRDQEGRRGMPPTRHLLVPDEATHTRDGASHTTVGSCELHAPYGLRVHMQVGHFNWKRAPREWMVRLCSQPHLPGGRATLWLCGHYHASCAVHSRAGTEVVTTGAVGGVINWSQPPQVITTSPLFSHSLTHSLAP